MSTRPDVLAFHAIQAGRLVVDTIAGTITTPTGYRVELVDRRTGAGRVTVSTTPLVYAMAHRIVWIAANGLIPVRARIYHVNGLHWDNRIANLAVRMPDHVDPVPPDPVDPGPDPYTDADRLAGLIASPPAPLQLRPSRRRPLEWHWAHFI